MTKLAINRARLKAGKPCIIVRRGKRMRHAAEVILTGPSVLRRHKIGGRWFIHLFTNSRVIAR